jgi:DNA-binding MarR family transcriptional regulator
VGESFRDYDGIISGMPTRQLRIPPPLHPGLTEQEVVVFEMLIRTGALSPSEIARKTALPAGSIDAILDRLIALQYVSRKGAKYEAEARPRSR